MTTIERLQALRTCLEAAHHKAATMNANEFTHGLCKGIEVSINVVDAEIKMIEAGEGEKA